MNYNKLRPSESSGVIFVFDKIFYSILKYYVVKSIFI